MHPPTTRPPNPEDIQPGHCQGCDYDLAGLPVGGACPECGRPIVGLCRGCGYDLAGLSISGPCPECGKPIADSLRGDLLAFAGPEYVLSLHRGAIFILASILLMVCTAIAAFVGAVIVGGGAAGTGTGTVMQFVQYGALAGNLVSTGLSVYGWYLFSTPDPGKHLLDRGDRPRQIVRLAVILTAAITIVNTVVELVEPGVNNPVAAGRPTFSGMMTLISLVLTMVGFVIWAVQFFAAMRYLRWMALRVPDLKLLKRAGTYTWLLPVLYIPGSIACGLGALIALVLYYNLLNDFRKAIRKIVVRQTVT